MLHAPQPQAPAASLHIWQSALPPLHVPHVPLLKSTDPLPTSTTWLGR